MLSHAPPPFTETLKIQTPLSENVVLHNGMNVCVRSPSPTSRVEFEGEGGRWGCGDGPRENPASEANVCCGRIGTMIKTFTSEHMP